jgi:hypothetical protein
MPGDKKGNRAFLNHLFSFTKAINAKEKNRDKSQPQIAQMTEEATPRRKEFYRNKIFSKGLTLPPLICVIREFCGLFHLQ